MCLRMDSQGDRAVCDNDVSRGRTGTGDQEEGFRTAPVGREHPLNQP